MGVLIHTVTSEFFQCGFQDINMEPILPRLIGIRRRALTSKCHFVFPNLENDNIRYLNGNVAKYISVQAGVHR